MMEQILEKLYVLDKQAKILEDYREKNTMVQSKKKSLITPLAFDLHVEFSNTVVTPTSKTASKITEDKSCDLKTSKTHTSSRCKPELRSDFEKSNLRSPFIAKKMNYEEKSKEENLKSNHPRPFHYLTDTTEAENAKPWHFLYSQHGSGYRRSVDSLFLSPKLKNQINACEKEKVSALIADEDRDRTKKCVYSTDHFADSIKKGRTSSPERKDFTVKEDKSTRNYQPSAHYPIRKNILIPLCLEDELKNPNNKILDINPAETVTSLMERGHTIPIIFHDTEYIQMLLLTKGYTSNATIDKRKNLVLERNCAIFKALFPDEPDAISMPPRTMLRTQNLEMQALSSERVHRHINEKRKKKNDSLPSEKRPKNTLYNLSQTLSSLTKKFVGYFDKDVIQEKSANLGEFEEMFSTAKPTHSTYNKFSAFPIKYGSKPLKNILEIRRLNNVTELDNLLNLPGEN